MKNGALSSLAIPRLPLTDDGKKRAHGDGRGLWVVCEPRADGSVLRSYYFRYTWGSERPWLSMGHIDELSLSAARIKAAEFRAMLRDGKDPRRNVDRTAAGQQTFLAYWEENKADFVGDGAEYPWQFAVHNFSKLHDRPIAEITLKEVKAAIEAYWRTNAVSASRSLMRISKIFNHARVNGLRLDNPALLADLKALGIKAARELSPLEAHPALPYTDLPAFMTRLAYETSITARCIEFAILTGSRSQEAREAQWSWLNDDMTAITMPAEVMKGKLKHIVPLSTQLTEMLRRLPRTSDYIFPSPHAYDSNKALMPHALVEMVNRVKGGDRISLHGFRSTFRDFGADRLDVAKEVLEFCLAHRTGSAVEKAYWRSDMLDKRRIVMQAYADYATGKAPTGNVVAFRAA
jgi:integrase